MAEGGTLGLTRPYGVVPILAAAAIGALVGFLGAGPVRGFADLRDVVFEARLVVPYAALPVGWLMVWAMAAHRPDSVLAVVAGLASLVPVAACGALLVGPRLGLLVAPLLVVAVTVLPTYLIDVVLLANSDASVAAVSYVWHLYHPLRGEMLVWQVEAFRVLFFLLVGVAALRAAAALAEWRAASNFHDGRGARHVAGVSGSEAIDPDLDASGRTLRVSRTLTGEV